jgi:LAS superfamily LD-carboxypeptidase LdcB
LQPSGVLDDETLYRMVSAWQGARLKNKEYARPDQLLLAPSTDFYDPSRPEALRQVERETYAAYKRMAAAAATDLGLKRTASGELAPEEKFLKIVSAFRSREYQANLRAQSPGSGRAGLAVNSPHFTGRALDLYVGGEPVETKDSNRAIQVQTAAYRWLVRNAERFGFRPYYYEPWHWEYVGAAATAAR